MVIVVLLVLLPLLLDARESGAEIAVGVAIWNRLHSERLRVENTAIRVIEVTVLKIRLGVPGSEFIASVASDVGEYVGTHVPASKGVKIPVGLDCRNLRVVVVVVGVGGSDKLLGHGITEENAENAVLDGVGLILIESDQNHGVLHEVLVV